MLMLLDLSTQALQVEYVDVYMLHAGGAQQHYETGYEQRRARVRRC